MLRQILLASGSCVDSCLNGRLGVKAQQTLKSAQETVQAVAEAVENSEQANEASTGILRPIYRLAEAFSFPAFHGVAFAILVAGVVSFVLQLTLGKHSH